MNQNTFLKLAKGQRLFFCAALIAVLGVSQVPVRTAQASIFERYQLRDRFVFAAWQYQEGDVISFVEVLASKQAALPGTQTAVAPTLAVSIDRSTLDGIVLVSALGYTNTFEFTVDNNLSSAHVAAALIFQRYDTGTLFPGTVDLTWNGTGDLTQEHAFEQFGEEGFIVIAPFHGARRTAEAAGTVAGEGINFTPFPSSSALIVRSDNGFVTVLTGPDTEP